MVIVVVYCCGAGGCCCCPPNRRWRRATNMAFASAGYSAGFASINDSRPLMCWAASTIGCTYGGGGGGAVP